MAATDGSKTYLDTQDICNRYLSLIVGEESFPSAVPIEVADDIDEFATQ